MFVKHIGQAAVDVARNMYQDVGVLNALNCLALVLHTAFAGKAVAVLDASGPQTLTFPRMLDDRAQAAGLLLCQFLTG